MPVCEDMQQKTRGLLGVFESSAGRREIFNIRADLIVLGGLFFFFFGENYNSRTSYLNCFFLIPATSHWSQVINQGVKSDTTFSISSFNREGRIAEKNLAQLVAFCLSDEF